jgi:DNA polymerase I-like protein with 3'-5' exonuclease and polymerase domains
MSNMFPTFSFPNVRKLFVPDHTYEFFDIDLDSADLRIVTWESNCLQMKQWFAEGKKPYVELMKEYYKNPNMTKHDKQYSAFKSLCHGTNYLGSANGVAPRVGLLVHEVDKLQKWYFGRNPEILAWQNKIKAQIDRQHFVRNAWGYRINAFDRIDDNIYREMVAWIPQSTVGILINHGLVNIDRNLKEVQVLLQTHDSLSGQYPCAGADHWQKRILEECTVPVPYADPLIIPVGMKCSAKSWGDCG